VALQLVVESIYSQVLFCQSSIDSAGYVVHCVVLKRDDKLKHIEHLHTSE